MLPRRCPRGHIYAPKNLRIHARAGEVGVAVVPRSYSRAAASSSSSGFSPAHSIISLQNSSIFSEQTERELILLLKTLRCYAFETVSANRARSQSKPVIQLVQWKYLI